MKICVYNGLNKMRSTMKQEYPGYVYKERINRQVSIYSFFIDVQVTCTWKYRCMYWLQLTLTGPTCSMFLAELTRKLSYRKKLEEEMAVADSSKNIVRETHSKFFYYIYYYITTYPASTIPSSSSRRKY